MAWNVIYDVATGRPRSQCDALPAGFRLPGGLAVASFPNMTVADLELTVWDAATKAFVSAPPTRPTIDPDNAWPQARKLIVTFFQNLTRAQKLALAQQAGVDLQNDLGITP